MSKPARPPHRDVAVKRRLTAAARRELIERSATELFAERGYRGTSVEEIARRSHVTVPVVYDHFPSKAALYQHLIARHYGELREIWFRHGASGRSLDGWIGEAVDEWFAYVEANPFAGRMLFRDTTGDPAIEAMHRAVQEASRDELLPMVADEAATAGVDLGAELDVALAWETLRAVLQGLALWWYEHPKVPRERIVRAAMNSTWIGLERFFSGEEWSPG